MKRIAVLLAVAALAAACQDDDVHCQWNEWKAQYGRVYKNVEEEGYRFNLFKERLAEITHMNREQPYTEFAVNQFSDMTLAEFKSQYLNHDPAKERFAEIEPEPEIHMIVRDSLPVNWTSPYTTPVQNQGGCGSCWAFSAIGAVEAAYKKATGVTEHFSEQQIVDCDSRSCGCGGGWPASGLQLLLDYSKKNPGGVMRASDYPYRASDQTCKYNAAKAVAKVSSIFNVAWDESTMDQKLYGLSPLSIALDATALMSYSRGVVMDSSSCRGGVNHAVLLAGWGEGIINGNPIKWWVVKNSWSTGWGEKGFFRIVRGFGACLMTTSAAAGAQCPSECVPKTCDARVCGSIDDGCGHTISCGTCPQASDKCNADCQCESCVPTTCGTRQCGTIDDGCGHVVSCGTCPLTTDKCTADGQCQSCVPQTCGSRQCGTIDDGCGHTVSCGTCQSGATCTADGQCQACVPQTCGSRICGTIDDGCGHTVSCGACPGGDQYCRADGTCDACVPTKSCAGRQCGTVDDGCGHTLTCGQCPAGKMCYGDGQCGCTPSRSCGQRQCGTIDNGCGAIVSCGHCWHGSYCLWNGMCQNFSNPSEWQEIPAGNSFDINGRNGFAIDTKGTLVGDKTLKWMASQKLVSRTWTSFIFKARSLGPGTMGMGMRMGQQSGDADGLFWKIDVTAGSAASRLYFVVRYNGKDTPTDFGDINWPKGVLNNFTVNFAMSGSQIASRVYVNLVPVLGSKYVTIDESAYPALGAAFIVASGSGKSYTNMHLFTRTAMRAVLRSCIAPSEWAAHVAKLLAIPQIAVLDLVGSDECTSAGKRQDGAEKLYHSFDFALEDENETVGIGQADWAPHTVEGGQMSGDLAQKLQSMIGDGSLSQVGVDVSSISVVDPVIEGIAVAIAAPTAALSVAAIAGIAAGGAAVVALAATTIGAAIYVAKRPDPKEPMPADFQPRNPLRKTIYKLKYKGGVDVINAKPGAAHQSITSRAPPIV